jgi:hypothetical protein
VSRSARSVRIPRMVGRENEGMREMKTERAGSRVGTSTYTQADAGLLLDRAAGKVIVETRDRARERKSQKEKNHFIHPSSLNIYYCLSAPK